MASRTFGDVAAPGDLIQQSNTIEAYRAEAAKTGGGSCSLKLRSRSMKIGARVTLERKDTKPEIMKYCDEIARMGGGSPCLLATASP